MYNIKERQESEHCDKLGLPGQAKAKAHWNSSILLLRNIPSPNISDTHTIFQFLTVIG